jgi:pimeloyl-ACP methyl ester carboxylesterase
MDLELDRRVERAQAALLERYAPETSVRRVRWSRGEVQVLELGTGPPLLLVHGALGSAFAWVPILQQLARQRHVVAVDLPGHGLADPFDYGDSDLLQLAVVFLRDVVDALPLREVDIVAHSVGGLMSAAFAIAEPRRVSRLVLAGAPAGIRRPGVPLRLRLLCLPVVGRWLAGRLLSDPTPEDAKKLWAQILVAHPERIDDALLDTEVETQRRDLPTYLSVLRCVGGAGGVRRDLILGRRWGSLKAPVLMLWGERDAFAPPEWGEDLAAGIPSMRLMRIPDAGHLPWIDDPQRVVSETERFLAA